MQVGWISPPWTSHAQPNRSATGRLQFTVEHDPLGLAFGEIYMVSHTKTALSESFQGTAPGNCRETIE